MPRLLLVDDNPSIHKIAETLLAASSIELVCVDSAAAALDKVNQGEHFDVALLDTSMSGMDGWGLLAKLREIPATARMPIAMMAGVLDAVDPERIKEAPIQGFLKKPVELRELGDRIAKLMETPVPIPEPPPLAPPLPPRAPSPFATMPAVRIEDLPEFRKRAEAVPEPQDDLLELTEEDLYPEEAPEELVEAPIEESLDLEELDLDSLRGFSAVHEEPMVPTPALIPGFPPLDEISEPTPQSSDFPITHLDAIATLDRLPESPASLMEEPLAELEITGVDLPDLGSEREALLEASTLSDLPEIEELATFEQVPATEIPLEELLEASPREDVTFTPPLPPLEESLDWSDDSESMLAAIVESPAPQLEVTEPAIPLPEEELDLLDVSGPGELGMEVPTLQADLGEAAPLPVIEPEETAQAEFPAVDLPPIPVLSEPIMESAIVEPMVASPVVASMPPASGLASKELLDVMMSDPAVMDALAKAVVARLGDQALREIAWEVIPELAERLPRN
jgi:CheY-like chemotaxis protein